MNKKGLLILCGVVALASFSVAISSANSEKDLKATEKTEKRLEAAQKDIKSTFVIDSELSNYHEAVGTDLNKLDSDLLIELDSIDQTVPVGSLKPSYYIRNDGQAVILLYKKADGENVMVKSENKDKKWHRTNGEKKGAPILKFEGDPENQ